MHQSKFIKILKSLSAAELKAFELWLKSPWCNTNKNLSRLLERLKKYYPEFEKKKLTKEKLFKQVLPNGKYSDRRMNNLLSEAYLAAERFLIFHQLENDQSLQQNLLTQAQQSRHLDTWFFKTANKAIAETETKDIKNWEDHLHLLRLHRRIYQHPNQQLRRQFASQSLVKEEKQLDLLYLLEKAVIINEKMARNRILKDETHDVTADLERWMQASAGIEHTAIELYRKRFSYEEEQMLGQYFELREMFLERYGQLNEAQQKAHLMLLLNDTIFLAKSAQLDLTDLLPLYRIGLEHEMLFTDGKITYSTYINIVTTSNTKRTFDFTYFFIENYSDRLNDGIRLDCTFWAKAHTAYRKGELETGLDLLQSHDFVHFYFKLVTRILNTQIYFDLYLSNPTYEIYLSNYFDAFEKWLSRDKVWSKANNIAFVRFVQKCRALVKLHREKDFSAQAAESLLTKEKNIQALNWLEQKRSQIIKLRSKE